VRPLPCNYYVIQQISPFSGGNTDSNPVAGELLFLPRFLRISRSCYPPSMRNLAVLFVHFIAVLARLLGPGGVRSLVAESLLLKHQLLSRNFLSDSFKHGLV
jgi:hypothetical protein